MRKQLFKMLAIIAVTATVSMPAFATTTGATSIDQIVAAVRSNPADLTLRRAYAQELIKKGLTVRAAEQVRLIIASGGQNAADLSLLGDSLRYSGDLAGAVNSYKSALTLCPSSAKARSGLSLTYAAAGDFRSAFSICQNGIVQATDSNDRQELTRTFDQLRHMQLAQTSMAITGTALF